MSQTLMPVEGDADAPLATRQAHNPFGAPAKRDASVETESQRAIAEVQAAMVIAQRFPRDQQKAMDRILTACTRPALAESAMYSFARGGTEITGPSIRLAEAIAQNWGNMKFGIRELEQRAGVGMKPGESTVEAFAWDVETNTLSTKTFQVPHLRYTRNGTTKLTDPRDIYELVANNGARRLRACILAVIPGDVTENAVRQCATTLATRIKVTPELIDSLVKKFESIGVSKKAIEARIQRRIDAITPALVVNLGTIYNSINDGMSAAIDWFEVDAATAATSAPVTAKGKLDAAVAAATKDGDPSPDVVAQLAALSGPELTKAIKGVGKEHGLGEDEVNDAVADCGGWGKAKANVAKILAKLREIGTPVE